VGRVDIDALEKEICIDIAELRRDLRALRKDLDLPPEIHYEAKRKASQMFFEGALKSPGDFTRQKSFLSEISVPEAEEEDDKSCISALSSSKNENLKRRSYIENSFKVTQSKYLFAGA
jgi:hypothetical protein